MYKRMILFSCALIALHTNLLDAQWVQTNGPKGGMVRCFVAVPNGGGTSLFAGGFRMWRSNDNGASWTQVSNGLTDPNAFAFLAVPNGSGGNDILVGTNGGVFRSTDNGASWNAINNGLTNLSIYALGSGPNGSGGTNLYAGTYLGNVFRSTDNGASWTSVSSGLPSANVNALVTTASGTILAGTYNGIYRSTNLGASWTQVLTNYGFSFARNGATIYAGTSNGVYRSTNDGASWTAINNGMQFNWVRAVVAIPNGSGVTLFAAPGGVLRSTDNGATWTLVNNGLESPSTQAMVTTPNGSGTNLFAGTMEGIFRTSNNGANWTDASFIYSQVNAVAVNVNGGSSTLLAGTENDVFRSTDGGANWTSGKTEYTTLGIAINPNGTLFAGGSPGGIFRSTNDGVSWSGSSNGLDDFDVNSMAAIPNGSGGTIFFAGTYSQTFISTNNGGFWQHANLQTLILDFVATPNGSGGNNIFAGGFGGVWLSTNNGTAWTPVNAGLEDKIVQAVAATSNGANIFAGTDPAGVFRSTNNGASWTPVNNGLTNLAIVALLSPDGTNLFAGGGGGVFLSTDNGDSWTPVNTGLVNTGVYSLAVDPNGSGGATLLAGTTGFGVWKRPLSEMISVTPPSPPSISSFTPTSGPVGIEVTITGSNLTGASNVSFNGTSAPGFIVLSANQIRANVPSGATTGEISVITPGGTAVSANDFTVTATPPPPSSTTFNPTDDAWVRSTSPSSNFGSRGELRVRAGSQTINSYLKFVVSGVTGPIQSATLRLFVKDASPDGGSVFSVSNNYASSTTPWTESGLKWNNAPPISGSALDAAGSVSTNTWVELDVTAAITGDGTYSFGIRNNSSNYVDYRSSEASNPPQLVVQTGSGAIAGSENEDLSKDGAESLNAGLLPEEIELAFNHPNPFNAETTIQYSLPEAMPVRLIIYDLTGRSVRVLVNGTQEAGYQRVIWDGRDEHGAIVNSGLYLYRLEAGGTVLTRKMTILK